MSGPSDLQLSVYNRPDEAFLGQVQILPVFENGCTIEKWYELCGRGVVGEIVTGEILVSYRYEHVSKKPLNANDFQQLRLIGKGSVLFIV